MTVGETGGGCKGQADSAERQECVIQRDAGEKSDDGIKQKRHGTLQERNRRNHSGTVFALNVAVDEFIQYRHSDHLASRKNENRRDCERKRMRVSEGQEQHPRRERGDQQQAPNANGPFDKTNLDEQ